MISSSEGSRPVPEIASVTATELSISGVEVVTPSTQIEAIKMGYRHLDTAAIYQTEKPVGEAVAEALRLGLIKSRSEVFIRPTAAGAPLSQRLGGRHPVARSPSNALPRPPHPALLLSSYWPT
ncbi:hypothetical protein E3N88_40395 [Mikania micrantha]|uniref:NADP-dependent oxidoreductase domain-containing protein n=1 Tax=Mikania micrantha TaxID=192012 RepID=A0A5N6LPU5_9ASTR|nr:hypothetical protein E3N88_40395 [Mikania micrantha]